MVNISFEKGGSHLPDQDLWTSIRMKRHIPGKQKGDQLSSHPRWLILGDLPPFLNHHFQEKRGQV